MYCTLWKYNCFLNGNKYFYNEQNDNFPLCKLLQFVRYVSFIPLVISYTAESIYYGRDSPYKLYSVFLGLKCKAFLSRSGGRNLVAGELLAILL